MCCALCCPFDVMLLVFRGGEEWLGDVFGNRDWVEYVYML